MILKARVTKTHMSVVLCLETNKAFKVSELAQRSRWVIKIIFPPSAAQAMHARGPYLHENQNL